MPQKKKSYFTAKELETYRKLLEEKRVELLEKIKQFESGQRATDEFQAHGDMGDLAAQEVDGAFQFRMLDKQRKLLNEVNHALSKFENGTYGICEGSEDYISKKRLKLRPWTRYSIEYKEYVDDMKKKRLAN